MARNQWQAMQDTVAGLTQALQNVVQAGNQAAAARNGVSDLHRNFRSLNPPRFSGSPDPDEAENWQEEIERIFQVMQCTNREKVVLATFQFTKDARALWKATLAHLPNVAELEWAGFLEIFRGKYFSERVKEKKAAEFAALRQKGMSMAEYEAQFARLSVYAPHLVGTERLKANQFMDGLRPMFIERLGPHNIQTYTEMVQRAQLVEDTMAKVEGMRGKDNSKPVFVKKGAPNIAPTFRNNNVNNNNKRPNTRRDVAGDKRVKMEGRQLAENCKFCDKSGHRAEECWKKLGACLRCGGRDHHIPDCPMMKDQPGRAQNVPLRQGCLNAILEADLPEEGGMVEGTISIHSQPAFVLIDTRATYSFISTTFATTLPVKPVPLKSKIIVASPLGSESELTHYLPKCETIIGGHNLPADLICLDMKGYDAILGVDWLIEYDADVNCRHRRRSSWWLRSCGTTTRSSSSSPFVCYDLHKPPSWSRAKAVLDRNPRTCPFSVDVRRRPCEGDGPIGRVLRSCRDSTDRRVLKATKCSVATLLLDLNAPSRSSHHPVAFWS
ncbi:hypothetical protein Taro_007740 [Colocasia esculenta]|uniref:CCHC-type domain-containing protein n=1 Tax=Colocasia esculenta TaxID=4460 RepID=A0A843TZV6_COLES|nr:hypothetical protein [Colocasia esculenta]